MRQLDLIPDTVFRGTPSCSSIGLSLPPIVQQISKEVPDYLADRVIYFPFIQMRPNYAVIYSQPSHRIGRFKEIAEYQFKKGIDENRYSGQLNDKSISKLRKAIELLLAISPNCLVKFGSN